MPRNKKTDSFDAVIDSMSSDQLDRLARAGRALCEKKRDRTEYFRRYFAKKALAHQEAHGDVLKIV